jgi:hypothetical protein
MTTCCWRNSRDQQAQPLDYLPGTDLVQTAVVREAGEQIDAGCAGGTYCRLVALLGWVALADSLV